MIQRIQSIFLAVIVIAAGLSFAFPVWTATEGPSDISVTNFYINYNSTVPMPGRVLEVKDNGVSVWYCAAMAIFAGIIAVYAIFRYDKRRFQNQLCHFGTFISSLWLATYFISIPKAKEMMFVPNNGSYGFAFFAPLIAIILFQVAGFYIRKDEELVRSADRLR